VQIVEGTPTHFELPTGLQVDLAPVITQADNVIPLPDRLPSEGFLEFIQHHFEALATRIRDRLSTPLADTEPLDFDADLTFLLRYTKMMEPVDELLETADPLLQGKGGFRIFEVLSRLELKIGAVKALK
jgi:hypothetical protein